MNIDHVVNFNAPVTFSSHVGASFYNATKGYAGSIVSVAESSPSATLTYAVDYGANPWPAVNDIVYFDYDGTGNYSSSAGIPMRPTRLVVDNGHPDHNAHHIHYKCEETSGNTVTCDITGSVITVPTSGTPTPLDFSVPNAIGWLGPAPYVTQADNHFRDIKEGQFIFYFCTTWWDVSDPRYTLTGNKSSKCSLQHLSISHWNIDFWGDITLASAGWGCQDSGASIKGDLDAHSYLRSSYPLGVFNPYAAPGRRVTGALVLEFDPVDCNCRYILDSGDTMYLVPDDPDHKEWVGGMCMRYPQSYAYESGNWSFGAGQPELYPSFKLLDTYVFGVYNFIDNPKTDSEIVTFLSWMDTEARAGNKERYPAWIGQK